MSDKFYTIKEMSAFTGISYQNLWYRLKKQDIIPVIEKTGFDDSSKYSLKQFSQILSFEETELLSEELKEQIRAFRKPTDSEILQDISNRMALLESHLDRQDEMIEELKKEIRHLVKKCKKK